MAGGQVRGVWGGGAPPGCSLIYAVNSMYIYIYILDVTLCIYMHRVMWILIVKSI